MTLEVSRKLRTSIVLTELHDLILCSDFQLLGVLGILNGGSHVICKFTYNQAYKSEILYPEVGRED